MNSLPYEIIKIILDHSKISDKRSFWKITNVYNQELKEYMLETIENFKNNFDKYRIRIDFDNKLISLSFELIYDGFVLPCSYMTQNNSLLNNNEIYFRTALLGHIELTKQLCLYTTNHNRIIDVYCGLAVNGNINLLTWVYNLFGGCVSITTAYASANGHHNVIRWCIKNNIKIHKKTCYCTIRNGQLKTLKYCMHHKYGRSNIENIYSLAITHEQIKIIKWLLLNDHRPTINNINLAKNYPKIYDILKS
jgi:hypothetical protein